MMIELCEAVRSRKEGEKIEELEMENGLNLDEIKRGQSAGYCSQSLVRCHNEENEEEECQGLSYRKMNVRRCTKKMPRTRRWRRRTGPLIPQEALPGLREEEVYEEIDEREEMEMRELEDGEELTSEDSEDTPDSEETPTSTSDKEMQLEVCEVCGAAMVEVVDTTTRITCHCPGRVELYSGQGRLLSPVTLPTDEELSDTEQQAA